MKEFFNVPPFKMITETELERWRYETWDTKEPETIAWIKSFEPQSTFLDIGGNIGIYSLACASFHEDCMIYAFEAYYGNASRLMQNIMLNKFENIIVMPIGISNINRIDSFGLVNREIGHSGSELGKQTDEFYLIPTMTIDSFCELWDEYPNYIKIDIDGQELQVIEGALRTIYREECESVLVEINQNEQEIRKIFEGFGYTTDNEFNKMQNHSRVRRKEEGINCENIIFSR